MSDSGWLRLETDRDALRHNISRFRAFTPAETRLLAVVKADGYGHGLLPAATAFLDGGADMLGVHAVEEAAVLRQGGVEAPVLILGPVNREGAALASRLDAEITVGSLDGAAIAAETATPAKPLRVHLKVETGVNRQGIVEDELDDALALLIGTPGLALVGVSSHFADIEDTTDHGWANAQSDRFNAWLEVLERRGHGGLARHMSCSAAAILWRSAYRDIVRVGIAAYGIWPSRETLVSARAADHPGLELKPAITWSCAVAQVRRVPAGETVGYGRAWRAPVDSLIAVLPVGYSDGYPRRLSQQAHVLIGGQRAPVRGRICMNLTMVDVTHIPGVAAGDTAVLLGAQGAEHITAEKIADWLGTIPYEVLTMPGPAWRRAVRGAAVRS